MMFTLALLYSVNFSQHQAQICVYLTHWGQEKMTGFFVDIFKCIFFNEVV